MNLTGWIRALALLLFLPLPAVGQEDVRIGELTFLDRQYMMQSRSDLEALASRNFGTGFNGNRDHDLTILQRLLDSRLVRADQTRELQAMGMVMGDLLAAEFDLHWVVYEDAVGRSRALRYRQTDNYLFPVTMVSRRREAGSDTSIVDIYARARAAIEPVIEPLPFQ